MQQCQCQHFGTHTHLEPGHYWMCVHLKNKTFCYTATACMHSTLFIQQRICFTYMFYDRSCQNFLWNYNWIKGPDSPPTRSWQQFTSSLQSSAHILYSFEWLLCGSTHCRRDFDRNLGALPPKNDGLFYRFLQKCSISNGLWKHYTWCAKLCKRLNASLEVTPKLWVHHQAPISWILTVSVAKSQVKPGCFVLYVT